MMDPNLPRLPNELILLVVSHLAPCHPNAILDNCHVITRTLLSLMKASRVTYTGAAALFRRYCLYIASNDQAKRFAASIEFSQRRTASPSLEGLGSPLQGITSLYLAPFTDEPEDEDAYLSSSSLAAYGEDSDRDEEVNGEDESDGESTQSDAQPSRLDSPSTVAAVCVILHSLSPTLRRLIVSMPLRSLYPEDDRNHVRRPLRRAFASLTNLEELVSIQDELFLSTKKRRPPTQDDVWQTQWPKLRRLALYNPDIHAGEKIWRDLAVLDTLETVVFTRADCREDWGLVDVKEELLNGFGDMPLQQKLEALNERRFTFVHIDDDQPPYYHGFFPGFLGDWTAIDPNNDIKFHTATVRCDERERALDPALSHIQDWVRLHAVRGTLWDPSVIGAKRLE
jgi:hypothetical protein